jgi:hypothetical protein
MIIIFFFVIIFGVILFTLIKNVNSQITEVKNDNELNKVDKLDNLKLVPSKTDITEIYNDIYLEPYGCFSLLDEKFFQKQINIHSKIKTYDSGIIIKNNQDIKTLVNRVINNGFDTYGYHIIRKYNGDFNKTTIVELGILGKLAGYNYLSVYKIGLHARGNVYLTYSPPMDKQLTYNADSKIYKDNLSVSDHPDYTLTPKLNNYTNEQENTPGKELSCGYPCLDGDKPIMFGKDKQLMCGSAAYPNIKTPTRFSVYRISEK